MRKETKVQFAKRKTKKQVSKTEIETNRSKDTWLAHTRCLSPIDNIIVPKDVLLSQSVMFQYLTA